VAASAAVQGHHLRGTASRKTEQGSQSGPPLKKRQLRESGTHLVLVHASLAHGTGLAVRVEGHPAGGRACEIRVSTGQTTCALPPGSGPRRPGCRAADTHRYRHGQQYRWPHSVTTGSDASSRHTLHSKAVSASTRATFPRAAAASGSRAATFTALSSQRLGSGCSATVCVAIVCCACACGAAPCRSRTLPATRSLLKQLHTAQQQLCGDPKRKARALPSAEKCCTPATCRGTHCATCQTPGPLTAPSQSRSPRGGCLCSKSEWPVGKDGCVRPRKTADLALRRQLALVVHGASALPGLSCCLAVAHMRLQCAACARHAVCWPSAPCVCDFLQPDFAGLPAQVSPATPNTSAARRAASPRRGARSGSTWPAGASRPPCRD